MKNDFDKLSLTGRYFFANIGGLINGAVFAISIFVSTYIM